MTASSVKKDSDKGSEPHLDWAPARCRGQQSAIVTADGRRFRARESQRIVLWQAPGLERPVERGMTADRSRQCPCLVGDRERQIEAGGCRAHRLRSAGMRTDRAHWSSRCLRAPARSGSRRVPSTQNGCRAQSHAGSAGGSCPGAAIRLRARRLTIGNSSGAWRSHFRPCLPDELGGVGSFANEYSSAPCALMVEDKSAAAESVGYRHHGRYLHCVAQLAARRAPPAMRAERRHRAELRLISVPNGCSFTGSSTALRLAKPGREFDQPLW